MPPATTTVHFADRDSVEVDYFGQGAFGAAFDPAGRMVRSDWRRTTVGVLVTRAGAVDVEGLARRWAMEPAAPGIARLSPRDTARGTAAGGGTLVVNRRSRIFGTQYDASADVGRIPLALSTGPPVEQLTIAIEDGTLAIRWAERIYTVGVGAP